MLWRLKAATEGGIRCAVSREFSVRVVSGQELFWRLRQSRDNLAKCLARSTGVGAAVEGPAGKGDEMASW